MDERIAMKNLPEIRRKSDCGTINFDAGYVSPFIEATMWWKTYSSMMNNKTHKKHIIGSFGIGTWSMRNQVECKSCQSQKKTIFMLPSNFLRYMYTPIYSIQQINSHARLDPKLRWVSNFNPSNFSIIPPISLLHLSRLSCLLEMSFCLAVWNPHPCLVRRTTLTAASLISSDYGEDWQFFRITTSGDGLYINLLCCTLLDSARYGPCGWLNRTLNLAAQWRINEEIGM